MVNTGNESYVFGEFRLDCKQGLLFRDGDVVPLTPKVLEVLRELVRDPGRVLTKDELLERVWPGVFVDEANLAQNISVLRKALGQTNSQIYIETIPKRGYRFRPAVETLAPVTAGEQEPLRPPSRESGHSRWKLIVIASLLGCTAALAAGYWSWRSERRADLKSVAVLPFVNMSSDPADSYLADGLTEELTHVLTRIRGLQVISRTSSFQFKGKSMDVREIGRRLQVSALIEGSVRKEGDHVRVTAQLTDARTGRHLWSEAYDGELRDILSLENRVASAIADKFNLSAPTPQSPAVGYNGDAEAYRLYLFGRYYWNLQTEDGLTKAVKYFNMALERSPDYALAYSGLADSYHRMVWNGIRSPNEAYPKARAAAERALALDPELPEARASRVIIYLSYDWDWPKTESELSKALDLNPSYAITHHWASHYWMARGQRERSLRESEQALSLDPTSISLNSHLAWHYYYSRQFDAAIQQCRNALEIEPAFAEAHAILGMSLAQAHRYDESIVALRDAVHYAPDNPTRLAALGWAYARAGRLDDANRTIAELDAISSRRYVSSYDRALIEVGLGNVERANQLLQKAYDERASGLVYLNVDPAMDDLRGAPEFRDLVVKMKLINR